MTQYSTTHRTGEAETYHEAIRTLTTAVRKLTEEMRKELEAALNEHQTPHKTSD